MFHQVQRSRSAIWLALSLTAGGAQAGGEANGAAFAEPEAYRRYANEEALEHAGGGAAKVLRSGFGKLPPRGYPIVCGTIRVNDEELSFATLWRPKEAVGKGATIVAFARETAARYRNGDAFAVQNARVCAQAGLAEFLPRGRPTPGERP